MTLDALLERSPRLRQILVQQLEAERDAIDQVLQQLSGRSPRSRGPERRKKQRRKRKHWTQRPEYQAKKNALIKKMIAGRKAKAKAKQA